MQIPVYYKTDAGFYGAVLDTSTGKFLNTTLIATQTSAGIIKTVASPVLYGSDQLTYMRNLGRWIPAPWNAISPDGKHYAYVSGSDGLNSKVHVVDAVTGTDSVIGEGTHVNVLDFQTSGLYLDFTNASGPINGSLVKMDPTTGDISPLVLAPDAPVWWMYVIGNYAYGNDMKTSGALTPNEIVRLDMTTGKEIRWGYPGAITGITPDGWLIKSSTKAMDASTNSVGILDWAGDATPIVGLPDTATPKYTDLNYTWFLDQSLNVYRMGKDHTAVYVVHPDMSISNWVWAGAAF